MGGEERRGEAGRGDGRGWERREDEGGEVELEYGSW